LKNKKRFHARPRCELGLALKNKKSLLYEAVFEEFVSFVTPAFSPFD